MPVVCPENKIFNALTFRCVKPDGQSGRRAAELIAQGAMLECPEGKFLNPLSGRCKYILSYNERRKAARAAARQRSRSPPRRQRSRSPPRRQRSRSPPRRQRSRSPPRRQRSRSPPRRSRTQGNEQFDALVNRFIRGVPKQRIFLRIEYNPDHPERPIIIQLDGKAREADIEVAKDRVRRWFRRNYPGMVEERDYDFREAFYDSFFQTVTDERVNE